MESLNTRLYCWLVLLHSKPVGTEFKREYLNGFSKKISAGIKLPTDKNIEGIVERELLWASMPFHHIITFDDPSYPVLLKEISNPPPVLFVQGNVANLCNQQIAIVGSRNPSRTGSDNAYVFAKELGLIGITITSGLAIGIDAASHKGALYTSGSTVAVFGTGIDNIYPKNHKLLAQEILDHNGTLITEFPLGTKPKSENFPKRNRIISGLSLGTLVVEATLRSGSLITARLAVEQGRDVFAIPGSIHNPLTKGCHQLIRQGAKLTEVIADIIEELPTLKVVPIENRTEELVPASDRNIENRLAKNYQKLLECIGFEITPIDILIMRSKFTLRDITKMLTILELDGLVQADVGGYIRVHK